MEVSSHDRQPDDHNAKPSKREIEAWYHEARAAGASMAEAAAAVTERASQRPSLYTPMG